MADMGAAIYPMTSKPEVHTRSWSVCILFAEEEEEDNGEDEEKNANNTRTTKRKSDAPLYFE
ncbi:hypothetical protein ABVT39_007055 [Epinephelus coioides]